MGGMTSYDDGWQPIETAPKDREILVYPSMSPGYRTCDIAKYDSDEYASCPRPFWNRHAWHKTSMRAAQPTHWRELPLPPDDGVAVDARDARIAELEAALEPFARADRAIGREPGPFRFETGTGHREIAREDLHRAGVAIQRKEQKP